MARRRFLRTATGILVGGPALLAACASDTRSSTDTAEGPPPPTDSTGTPPTDAPTTSAGTATVAPASSEPATTTSSATAAVWRLSTRNQRAPCGACKAHAAHRFYATSDAADGGRAHPGCVCAIVQQQVPGSSVGAWFDSTDRVVFDDRWA